MDLTSYSQEIQNFIEEAEVRRNQKGWLDFDTCQRVLEYAAETNSDALFGLGYYRFAEFYWNKQDIEKTLHCLEECIKCFCNANMYDYLARAYNLMAVASGFGGNRLVALSYFYMGMRYAEKSQDVYIQAVLNTNIAYNLLCIKRYKDAKERSHESIRLFKQSEYTVYRNKNLIWSMVRCGFCHLLLEETDEALRLWDEIQSIMQESSERDELAFILRAFEVGCEVARGNRRYAMRVIDSMKEAFRQTENLQQIENMIIPIADLLDRANDTKLLEALIEMLDENKERLNISLYLDMYPYKSRFLLKKNNLDEYVACSREYLELYHQHINSGRMVTARVLELQDKLSRIEAEQRDMRAYNQKLEEIALYDSLTSLPNRAYLNEYLSRRFEEAGEKQCLYGVELLDIDNFKKYNDTYGHLQGDVCLEAVANILRGMVQENVFCARYGGDEFTIIYSGMTDSEIREIAETIQRQVRELEILQEETGEVTRVTVSQGVFVRVPEEQNREWDFNRMADIMLYQAKQEEKNTYRIATEFQ